MKVQELLEAPLPDNIDEVKLDPSKPISDVLRYLWPRAQFVDEGSTRAVFQVDFEGRPTVIKISTKTAGLAQNKEEARVLSDPKVAALDIVIPIIDYDENHKAPWWIHMEYAAEMTVEKFQKFFNGFTPYDIVTAAELVIEPSDDKYAKKHMENFQEMVDTNSYFKEFIEFLKIQPNLFVPDFGGVANWGIYKNKPVIVDVGVTTEAMSKYR